MAEAAYSRLQNYTELLWRFSAATSGTLDHCYYSGNCMLVYLLVMIPPSMPRRSVSLDLKARIPIIHYSAGYSVKEIYGILGIRKSFVYQTLQYYAVHGVCYNPNTRKRGTESSHPSISISSSHSYPNTTLSTWTKFRNSFSHDEAHRSWSLHWCIPSVGCTSQTRMYQAVR